MKVLSILIFAGVAVASSCSGGFYTTNGGKTCKQCVQGNQCTDGETMTTCPIGTYSGTGQQYCTACAAGTYQTQTGKTSCMKCPVGSYNQYTGQSSASACQTCGGDRYSPSGSTSSSACIMYCPAGNGVYNDGSGTPQCIPCPAGTAKDYASENGGCTPCKPGFYQDQTGQQTCQACAVNHFNTNTGADNAGYCQPCPSDKPYAPIGSSKCTKKATLRFRA